MPRPPGVTVLSVRTSPAREASAKRASVTWLVDCEVDVRLRLRARFAQNDERAPLSRFALRLPLTTGRMFGPRCGRLAGRRVCVSRLGARRPGRPRPSMPAARRRHPEANLIVVWLMAAQHPGRLASAVIFSGIASSAVLRASSPPSR